MNEDVTQEINTGPPAPEKRHWLRWIVFGAIALIALFIGIGVGLNSKTTTSDTVSRPSVSASPAPVYTSVTPTPTASPDGKFQGSCNYILGNDPANGTAVATGDINVINDGNIGIKVKVTITWPQEGFSPLSETKTVEVTAGQSQDVQFNKSLSYDELSNLQNYQSGHSDAGCTYNGAIVDTFGAVQGD